MKIKRINLIIFLAAVIIIQGCFSGIKAQGSQVKIYAIQGEQHQTPYLDKTVTTTGIVTAIASNGFYLQDSIGDKNNLTSDGIFVFTRTNPRSIKQGDLVEVTGKVNEFIPKPNNLSVTNLADNPRFKIVSRDHDLPMGIILGINERQPPTEVIDDDNFAVFDPDTDGVDFYETLEGMRVIVQDALAVSSNNSFGEIYTVVDGGINATGISERGTINININDYNPERIQIDDQSPISPKETPTVKVGDRLGDVTGIVSYNFGNYEVIATDSTAPRQIDLQPEITELIPTSEALTIASYNVLNLAPDNPQEKFEAIAKQIITNLRTPDIIALQEIQDNSGALDDGVVDASQTYETLIAAIINQKGVKYNYLDIPPSNGSDGGQPGGNIRVGYLYNPARVELITDSVERIETDAFVDTRKPLIATFRFNNNNITVINNHLTSKGGSSPLFGQIQPPINNNQETREAQTEAINNYVKTILLQNPQAKLVVLGDFNEFEFLPPLTQLTTLANLTETLPENERYTYIFEGNSQAIDHILVNPSLLPITTYDIVHTNVEFSELVSDHEPVICRIILTS
ncbi:endonuclease/exonuclease/phosphatase family protein [Gloeocapsa sp. PCC 73106]|uniref:endonuclease/exonuclease/phosphatase family protein n=1 Tax=Gloeocapsa sp. PCC 73106 TaxID=102232 RepID=UPI0002ACACF6|nr:endonuclease/exonuclease/phosphatase family protein [Gloeocapsa sp. PCC 73106]ELR97685.1 putative extracellular nuclease [Gloeocapsa sp. PCC 73106]